MLKRPHMWWIVAQQGESSWGWCDVFHYTSAAVLSLSLPPSAHHVLQIALHLRFPSLCRASSHVLLPWPAPLSPLFSHRPPPQPPTQQLVCGFLLYWLVRQVGTGDTAGCRVTSPCHIGSSSHQFVWDVASLLKAPSNLACATWTKETEATNAFTEFLYPQTLMDAMYFHSFVPNSIFMWYI